MTSTLLSFFLLILSISCNETEQRIIIISNGCKNVEILDDLKLSIENNISFFRENRIKISYEKKSPCGYKLIEGKREKTIKSVLTDIDLYEEAKEFYNIK